MREGVCLKCLPPGGQPVVQAPLKPWHGAWNVGTRTDKTKCAGRFRVSGLAQFALMMTTATTSNAHPNARQPLKDRTA